MRLIDADAAIKAFENGDADVIEDYDTGCDFGFGIKNIKDTLNAIPTVDAVPVVRCKDCKHGHCYNELAPSWECLRYLGSQQVNENDYCSYGVRKEIANDR